MPELTYKQLQAAVAAEAKASARAAEAIRNEAKQLDEHATDTGRTAESIAALRVDKATVAETRELAKITAGLSEAVLAYATAGDNTARAAQAAHEQNRASHDGIQQAVSRSTVGRDIYDVDREWLRQE